MNLLDVRNEDRAKLPERVRHAMSREETNVREMVVLVRNPEDENVIRYLAEMSGYWTTYPMGRRSGILLLRKAA